MTTPLQTLLDHLGWSRQHAADRMRCSPSSMRWWAEGRNSRGNPCEAPTEVVAWLQRCARAVDGVALPRSRL